MDVAADMIAEVRRFNRTVTQRIGALQDTFLSRDRPLGQARLLWELGVDGSEVRALRERLDLDAGYVSRLLRSLEAGGLVEVGPGGGDRRVRTARLTAAGVAERSMLDRGSDRAAATLLGPLGPRQRARLVTAMVEVERLLTASAVQIGETDPGAPGARACLEAYAAELAQRFEAGFDAAASHPATDVQLTRPAGFLLLAILHGEPVGCGAVKLHPGEPAEIKRMWVSPQARGLGLGRRLLGELERRAAVAGAHTVRLETNRALTEAICLYRAAGYREVPAFNDETYAHHWFEKRVAP
jgi:ribosomal protein S18 acetylase RimI-like enzyme/DNA-binding MarR family transcriptional regulator